MSVMIENVLQLISNNALGLETYIRQNLHRVTGYIPESVLYELYDGDSDVSNSLRAMCYILVSQAFGLLSGILTGLLLVMVFPFLQSIYRQKKKSSTRDSSSSDDSSSFSSDSSSEDEEDDSIDEDKKSK